MSSQSDEENKSGVIPIVSGLLSKAATRIHRYDRAELLRINKEVKLCTTRPDNLSTDFNGDDGKFSPLKWLEHRWEIEGVKNRQPAKKLQESLGTGGLDDAGLSPQRRAFSGGCRAPPGEEKSKEGDGWVSNDRDRERLGSSSNKSWRGGVCGNMVGEKYSNGKTNDFKLPFQKKGETTRVAGSGWRTVEGGKEREKQGFANKTSSFGRNNVGRDRDVERVERVPEWADGPTTMDDMIELRGFEELPKKGKKKANEKEKAKIEKDKPEKKENGKSDRETTTNSDTRGISPPEGNANVQLPREFASDAEFAVLLGLDSFSKPSGDVEPQITNNAAPPAGSRLARFFNKNANSNVPEPTPDSALTHNAPDRGTGSGGRNSVAGPNAMLAKIFAHSPSPGSSTPGATMPAHGASVSGLAGAMRPMRLEDLEKDIVANTAPGLNAQAVAPHSQHERQTVASRGDPLQDPNLQFHLMNKLQQMAKMQEHERTSPPQLTPAAPQMPPSQSPDVQHVMPPANGPFPGMFPPGPIPPNSMLPPAFIAHMMETRNAMLHAQLQQAIAAATISNGGVPPSPAIQEQMKANLIRAQAAQHQQMLLHAHQQMQQQQQQQQAKARPQTTSMIPASVQRNMSKATASTSHPEMGDKKERDAAVPENAETGALDAARQEILKKMHMHSRYNAIMSAMQGGLPMASWTAPTGPMVATPQGQQLMSQLAAQAQQLRGVDKQMQQQHQQHLLMRMMQQQHLQAQMTAQAIGQNPMALGSSRPPAHQPQTVPSELAQVGAIQSPLERLLKAAGVDFVAGEQRNENGAAQRLPASARAINLEELERQLTDQAQTR